MPDHSKLVCFCLYPASSCSIHSANSEMQCDVCCSVLQDVTAFLSWAAEPEHDDRKLMGVKWIFVLSLVFLTAAYYKRWKWAPIKSRRVVVDALN